MSNVFSTYLTSDHDSESLLKLHYSNMSPYLGDESTSPRRLRIALLECDVPIGKTKEKYGTYGNLFQVLLEASAKYLEKHDSEDVPELQFSKYDVVEAQEYPSLDDIDAVLLTGSRKS